MFKVWLEKHTAHSRYSFLHGSGASSLTLSEPEFFGHRLQTSDGPCDSGGQHDRSGPKNPYIGCQEEFRLRDEKAADAGLGLLLWGAGQLLVIHTPWVAISVVSSVATTSSTVQQHGYPPN